MVPDIVFQTVEQNLRFLDTIDAYQGHVGFGDLRFLHHPFDAAVVFELRHAEIPGVVDSFYAQQGMRLAEDIFYIVFANSVAQYDKDLVVTDDLPGEQYGVADALPLVLIDEMRRELRIFLFDEVLDLFPEIAYDEDEFGDTGFHQLVDDDRENSFSR